VPDRLLRAADRLSALLQLLICFYLHEWNMRVDEIR
jgi:hypothetical protein